jgi:hypothetical protein
MYVSSSPNHCPVPLFFLTPLSLYRLDCVALALAFAGKEVEDGFGLIPI